MTFTKKETIYKTLIFLFHNSLIDIQCTFSSAVVFYSILSTSPNVIFEMNVQLKKEEKYLTKTDVLSIEGVAMLDLGFSKKKFDKKKQ